MTPAAQLAQEIETRIVTPAVTVLGPDLAHLSDRAEAMAAQLAAQLAQDDDDRLAADTAIDVLCALWPERNPDPEWWASPLGRLVAKAGGMPDADAVTYATAAAMLGVTRGTVSQLVHRGTLARHPDGGIDVGSVLHRIRRLG